MAFTGGDGGRTMQVLFLCDPTLAGSTQVSAKEQPQGSDNYVITVRAAAACPTGDCPAVPWSTGWLVFTLTCVFICVYFVCGSYYNYRFQDAEGLDVIPQWRYWQQLPGLVKDGCIFSRAKAAIFYRLALNAIRQCSDSSKEMRDGGATSGLVPAASDG
jgi:hypothetical protein